jgi:hypothetical protein
MSLNNTTADILANAICAALGVVDTPSITAWQTIIRQIYANLKIDAVVSVASVGGVTTGGGVSGPGSGVLT